MNGKHIIIGITGGIAAYKSCYLIRHLRASGAEVRVVMTASAKAFVSPLTLQALSGHPVHDDLFDPAAEAAMGHIQLAKWADVIVIAPATANCIAKLAKGEADDLLTTVCLATNAPIAYAPAMNQAMWRDASVQENCQTLIERGFYCLGPAEGEQACGDVGPGRMVEPEAIFSQLTYLFLQPSLKDQKVVITAGPTQEALDPVRYLTNHSSGKMGFALAQAASEFGASVTLISGPVNLPSPTQVRRIDVVSALDMQQAVLSHVNDADIFIATAAVADYRPKQQTEQKIKKAGEEISLNLIRNPDIVKSVTASQTKPYTIAFAAETENLIAHAKAKLIDKNADMVIANQVGLVQGFMRDCNEVTVITPGNEIKLPLQHKRQLARELMSLIIKEKIHAESTIENIE